MGGRGRSHDDPQQRDPWGWLAALPDAHLSRYARQARQAADVAGASQAQQLLDFHAAAEVDRRRDPHPALQALDAAHGEAARQSRAERTARDRARAAAPPPPAAPPAASAAHPALQALDVAHGEAARERRAERNARDRERRARQRAEREGRDDE